MSDVVVKDSSIHGKGLFAARPFQKGEVVLKWKITWLNQEELARLPESDHIYLGFYEGKTALFGAPERYINHSCDSNTTIGDYCDIASRNIETGEEITSDYSGSFIPGGSMVCTCGSNKCRRIINGKKPPVNIHL
jgi:SET domain-containing protein